MLKPILKFTGKAKCAFGLCLLLLLATLSGAAPTEKYEPTYTKLKTVNNVIHYKIKVKEIPFNKLGIKIDKSIERYIESLDVKYNPYRGLVTISTEEMYSAAEVSDLYAVINVYDSDSMWIGSSERLDLDHSYKNQNFLDFSEIEFAKFIRVTLKYKENDDDYFLRERLECKDGGDTIFYVQTKKNPNGDKEYLLTCDIANLDENGFFKQLSETKLPFLSRKAFVYLEKYKDCSDTKKYFGLDSTTNECIEIATCLDDEFYDNTDNSCYTIPANSHLIANRLWECNSGYVGEANACFPIPSNSYKVDNFMWTCNDGYVKKGKNCSSIPLNSHKISDFMWECNDGYWEIDGSCVPQVTCSESEIYKDWTETECSTIPLNSHKISDFMWACDDDEYNEVDGACADTRIISPYVKRHIDFSFAAGFMNIAHTMNTTDNWVTHSETTKDEVTHAYKSYKPIDMSFGLEFGIQGINTLTNDTLSSLGFNVAAGMLLNTRTFEDFAQKPRYADPFNKNITYTDVSTNLYIELGMSLNIYSIGVYAYIRPICKSLTSRKFSTIYDVLPDSEYMFVNNFGILLGKNFTSHFGLFAGYESLKTIDGPIVPSFELRARITF